MHPPTQRGQDQHSGGTAPWRRPLPGRGPPQGSRSWWSEAEPIPICLKNRINISKERKITSIWNAGKKKAEIIGRFLEKNPKILKTNKGKPRFLFSGNFSFQQKRTISAKRIDIYEETELGHLNHIRPRSDETYEIKAGIPKISMKKPRKLSPIAASWAIPSPRSAMLPFSLMYWLRRVQVTAKLVLPCFRPASAMTPRSTVEAIDDPRSPFCSGNRHGFADHLLRPFHSHDPTQLGSPAILPSSAFVYSAALEHVILAQRREI